MQGCEKMENPCGIRICISPEFMLVVVFVCYVVFGIKRICKKITIMLEIHANKHNKRVLYIHMCNYENGKNLKLTKNII